MLDRRGAERPGSKPGRTKWAVIPQPLRTVTMPLTRREMIMGSLLSAGAVAIPTRVASAHTTFTPPATAQSRLGYMFPGLSGCTSPTVQDLADLAQTQLDPDQRSPQKNTTIPSG